MFVEVYITLTQEVNKNWIKKTLIDLIITYTVTQQNVHKD